MPSLELEVQVSQMVLYLGHGSSSDSAKAKSIDSVLEAVEEFARSRLSERQWLQGGLEVIDEVTPFLDKLNTQLGLTSSRTQ